MPAPQRLYSPEQLGLHLRAARKARGLTQAQVGQRLQLSQGRVSSLELDPRGLTVEQLLTWMSVLGVELFLAGRDSPAPPTSSPASPTRTGAPGEDTVEW